MTTTFKPTASRAKLAIVLIFDLENFSKFFNQPDVELYVTKFLNRVFECVSIVYGGGTAYWYKKPQRYHPLWTPTHTKFLGDGGLYIWTLRQGQKTFDRKTLVYLVNRLWNLKNNFDEVVKACSDDVPVVDLPKKIRFGLSLGYVHQLTYSTSPETEYIGYSINLASRLQAYCRELGFIASARLGIPESLLTENNYIKVIAKDLKGFPPELVVVDKGEFSKLPAVVQKQLFEIRE